MVMIVDSQDEKKYFEFGNLLLKEEGKTEERLGTPFRLPENCTVLVKKGTSKTTKNYTYEKV